MNESKISTQKVEELLGGIELYLVGGAVRDLVLGNEPKDYDYSTPNSPDEVEQAILKADRHCYAMGKKFGTIGFKYEYEPKKFEFIEITTFRSEHYTPGSRKPAVEFTTNMQADMSRRDFTINAMALHSNGELWDEYGGQLDLQNKIVRAVGSPKQRFKEDPLRILRAVRFATKYNFEIESETERYCKRMNWALLDISKERWVIELDKILGSENVKKGLGLLMDLELLKVIIPTLELQQNYNQNSPYHDFTLWEHTKNVVANVPKENLNLRWAALLHDIAKPFTRTENPKGHSNYLNHDILGAELASQVCAYLKFSKVRTDYIVEQIKNHLKPESDLKQYDDAGKKLYYTPPTQNLGFDKI